MPMEEESFKSFFVQSTGEQPSRMTEPINHDLPHPKSTKPTEIIPAQRAPGSPRDILSCSPFPITPSSIARFDVPAQNFLVGAYDNGQMNSNGVVLVKFGSIPFHLSERGRTFANARARVALRASGEISTRDSATGNTTSKATTTLATAITRLVDAEHTKFAEMQATDSGAETDASPRMSLLSGSSIEINREGAQYLSIDTDLNIDQEWQKMEDSFAQRNSEDVVQK